MGIFRNKMASLIETRSVLEVWLKKNLLEILPKSSIGQAIAYTM